jgi:4-amino-4-deoxy-L-arabinose transferase-like glycosyltransferase
MNRRAALLAAALGLCVTGLLVRGHQNVGYVRDEGIYFHASRAYADWSARVLAQPSLLADRPLRDRAFSVNREHPALMKIAGGLSARLFSEPGPPGQPDQPRAHAGLLPLLPEGAAMRLPAQLLAGLGAALLFLAGWSLARRDTSPAPAPSDLSIPPVVPALLAALAFIGLPHVWYHAGLHAFDVPVAVLTLAVVLCYRRALSSARWSLLLGPLLGVAISIKHNALFIPLLLGVHYLASLALARRRPTRGQWLPLPFVSMAVLAPPTVLALWPWLWSEPVARLGEYFEFHRLHAYYNTEYFSLNYNQPPLPWSYPFVLTWATVPSALLLLAAIGLALAVRRDLSEKPSDTAPPTWTAPLRGHPTRDGLLWLLFALFPLLLISLPTIPIFGGTKHWLTAYPFLALAAAHAWVVLWETLAPRGRARLLPAALLPLVLVPALWSTAHGHPYGISQYAPLVGGARGAADLGLLRGFWGGSVLPLLEDMSLQPAPLHVHDLHELARQQYEREGRWPPVPAVPLSRARAALLFHERHMLSDEIAVWNTLGTTSPSAVLTLDDVPLTSLYRSPR